MIETRDRHAEAKELHLNVGDPASASIAGGPAGIARRNPEEDLSLFDIANVALRGRWLILFTPIVTAALIAVITILWPQSYTSTVSFTPSGGTASASTLAGLAAQFGVTLPTSGSGGLNGDFFASLVIQKSFLLPVVQEPYTLHEKGKLVTKTFAQLHGIEEATPEKTWNSALVKLTQDEMDVTSTSATSLVAIAVQTRNPELSVQVGQRILAQVDSFAAGLQRRRLQAELRFVQERLDSSLADLRGSEARLQDFLVRNRTYGSDPILQFQYDHLQRDVALRQSVYTSLRQSFEQTRIEVTRDTPAIAVVQPATPPLVADSKHLLLKLIIGLLAGGILGCGLAIFREIVRRSPRNTPGFSEFQTLRHSVVDDLRTVRRRVADRLRSRSSGISA
jgi:uncharacterized protein involved in exopolysaccharide biosynthesis